MVRRPGGISEAAFEESQRVKGILEDAGYEVTKEWYDWMSADDYSFDFIIPSDIPGVEERTLNKSVMGVQGGLADTVTLRFPELDSDEFSEAAASAAAEHILVDTGMEEWATYRVGGQYFGDTLSVHITNEGGAMPPDAIPAARQIAAAKESFEEVVFALR